MGGIPSTLKLNNFIQAITAKLKPFFLKFIQNRPLLLSLNMSLLDSIIFCQSILCGKNLEFLVCFNFIQMHVLPLPQISMFMRNANLILITIRTFSISDRTANSLIINALSVLARTAVHVIHVYRLPHHIKRT